RNVTGVQTCALPISSRLMGPHFRDQSNCANMESQQSASRNGGKARASTARATRHRRQRQAIPFRNSADTRPIATASNVVNALTSRLFLSSVQFMENHSVSGTGVPPVRIVHRHTGETPVPLPDGLWRALFRLAHALGP